MIERLAITAVGVAATVVLTVGLVAAGFTPRPTETDASVDAALLAAVQASAGPTSEPTLEPEIVYVKPAPTARTVVVERQATSRSSASSRGAGDTRPVRLVRGKDDDDRWEREDHEERERDDD